MALTTTENKDFGIKKGGVIREDSLTRSIENKTAKVPSVGYLGLAVGTMATSAVLAFVLNKKELANFIGLWAPSILIMGLYNKMVKIEHEDLHLGNGINGSKYVS